MRAAALVALVTVCLGLAGCSLFGKKHAAQTNNRKPFLGSSEPADKAETSAKPFSNGGALPNANGVLAGKVLIESTGRPARAYVQVKNLEEDDKAAKLDVETTEGYFTIPGLKPGQQYLLIARAEEDGELISGKFYAKPPQVTLLIQLAKRFTDASTPPLPKPPDVPGKKGTTSAESAQEHKPAVSIDAPRKLLDQGSPSASPRGTGERGGLPPAAGSVNPANIADSGIRNITPPSEPVNIPNTPPPPPPPPQPHWDNVPGPVQPSRPVSGPPGSVRLPDFRTPVPSCLLRGNRLENFALHDLDGNVWEYRNRRGRLMLLDFWHHGCHACLMEIRDLVDLQRDYGSWGLEVVGIACETGTLEEQQRNVRSYRGRYGINYTTLLSGGGPEHCPVVKQFQVAYYPLLVLIDSEGTILWRSTSDGMDRNENYRLRKKIDGILVTRQPPS